MPLAPKGNSTPGVTNVTKSPFMSPKDRRQLIEAPIRISIFGGQSWGGASRSREDLPDTYPGSIWPSKFSLKAEDVDADE